MKLSIISSSLREDSQSKRIANILKDTIIKLSNNCDIFTVDLINENCPYWSSNKKDNDFYKNKWINISKNFQNSDGFILVVPEYGGMASPLSKNLFLMCDNGEFFHKPGLIVSISSGNGGAYPISELRSSSYKNSHIMWIPENIIIRNVEQFSPGNHGDLIPKWIDDRIEYACNLLINYAECLKPIQKKINRKDFANGM